MSRADKYGMFEIPVGSPTGGPAFGERLDPITATVVLLGASTAMSAISSIQQGKAEKAAADYNANISLQNAQISRVNAEAEAGQIGRENYLRLGAIRAAAGRNGGVSGEGSVLDILGDVAGQGELEKQQAIYQGELSARGYTNTATLDRFSGKNAQRAGYMKAGADILGGAANAYGTSQRLNRK